jgi:hypothetical protein
MSWGQKCLQHILNCLKKTIKLVLSNQMQSMISLSKPTHIFEYNESKITGQKEPYGCRSTFKE